MATAHSPMQLRPRKCVPVDPLAMFGGVTEATIFHPGPLEASTDAATFAQELPDALPISMFSIFSIQVPVNLPVGRRVNGGSTEFPGHNKNIIFFRPPGHRTDAHYGSPASPWPQKWLWMAAAAKTGRVLGVARQNKSTCEPASWGAKSRGMKVIRISARMCFFFLAAWAPN